MGTKAAEKSTFLFGPKIPPSYTNSIIPPPPLLKLPYPKNIYFPIYIDIISKQIPIL